jgi:hypothetical protein
MKEAKRAERRSQAARSKDRARQVMRLWAGHRAGDALDPREIGVNASTHCRPCSCHLCRHDGPTRQERIFQGVETF